MGYRTYGGHTPFHLRIDIGREHGRDFQYPNGESTVVYDA